MLTIKRKPTIQFAEDWHTLLWWGIVVAISLHYFGWWVLIALFSMTIRFSTDI